jgi:asparagine synthase (glutamine-hydrolysing)
VLGVEMPVFPKRRFQHGAVAREEAARLFRTDETRYRRHFEALHAAHAAAAAASAASAE